MCKLCVVVHGLHIKLTSVVVVATCFTISLAYLFRYDVDARPSAVQLSHLSEVIESSRVGEEWVPGTRKLLLYLQLGELASSITRRRGGPRASSSS